MHKDSPVQLGVSLTPKGLSGGFSGWLSVGFAFRSSSAVFIWLHYPHRCIHQCCKQAHIEWKKMKGSVTGVASVSFSVLLRQRPSPVRLFLHLRSSPAASPPSLSNPAALRVFCSFVFLSSSFCLQSCKIFFFFCFC